MKNLNFIDKLLYFVNSILSILLLFSFLLQFIKPSLFPYLSFMSLSVPILIIINLLFFIYWLVKLKKQFILSLFVLLIGYSQVLSFFKFSWSDLISIPGVFSFNLRVLESPWKTAFSSSVAQLRRVALESFSNLKSFSFLMPKTGTRAIFRLTSSLLTHWSKWAPTSNAPRLKPNSGEQWMTRT